jgi:hypothetical protein
MTVGEVSTSVKGIFQQQAKTVANLCAAARPDLTVRNTFQINQHFTWFFFFQAIRLHTSLSIP